MTGPQDLDGPALAPAAGGPARQLVVLLHGVGADGRDLLSLGQEWREMLPHAAFAAPNAPFPCDMAPYGFQWFSLQDRSLPRMLAGIQAAAPILTRYLEAQRAAHGLPWSKVALAGFSQGTMMSLHVAPRLAEPVAGVLGYSGAMLGPELLASEVRSRPPVLLVHGDADEVVPPQATPMAATALTRAGFQVEAVMRPGLGHWLDAEGIAAGGRFLASVLGS
ncbi:MAG TPA: prolyl oligopeptidase family serine peptidase [Azospirillaceae bacterium]|nr:prolyl oligopeptidase family serine peptidase [Azospirillaceae bacterium]